MNALGDSARERQAIVDQFSDYYDDELNEREERAFEQYLEHHPGCREEYEAFAQSLEMMHQLQMVFAPEGLAQEVTRKINRQTHGEFFKESFLGSRIPYEIFVVLLLTILGTLLLFGQTVQAPLSVIAPTVAPGSAELHVPLPQGQDLNMLMIVLRAEGWRVELEGDRLIEAHIPLAELGAFAQTLHQETNVALPPLPRQHERVIIRMGIP